MPVVAIGVILAAVLIAVSGRYGYHRDELYFLACGRHLAWGYPDQPALVPLIARLMSDLAPNSLVLLRLPSALACALLVILAGLLAREFGAGRTGQILAAAGVATAPLVLGSGHLLSTTAFDLPAWAAITWLIARILRTGRERLWLAVGVVAAVGLNDSDLVAFLLLAVVIGLAIGGPRQPFRSRWAYAGAAIAVVAWLPYLLWQARYGWPELSVANSIANGGSGTSAPRWEIVPYQFALLGPILAAMCLTGLLRLFRDERLRWSRVFGIAYLVLIVAYTVTGGKPYYLGGMAPVLAAAGAQPMVDWLRRGRVWAHWTLVGAGALVVIISLPVTLPLVPAGDLHKTSIVKLNYDAGETVGWPAFVREIAAVRDSLPAATRGSSVVLASNYGEAGAVEHYGPADGLTAVYSGHNGFWFWGPPPAWATTAIAVGFDRGSLSNMCGSLRLATYLNNRLDVNDDEQGAPVWVCSDLRAPWQVLWPRLKSFG